jgi:hypothetical protein
LRFLDLKLSTSETGDLDIQFTGGVNILSISDEEIFSLISQIPFAGIYGTEKNSINYNPGDISCTINASSALSGNSIRFTLADGKFNREEYDTSGECINKSSGGTDSLEYSNIYTSDDFLTSSFFSLEQIEKNDEPVLDREKVKSLLIRNELCGLNFPFFRHRENLMLLLERELTSLDREKQLLELKKMKKEKLLKEIHISERGLQKLGKRKESILKYKADLTEILSKIEDKNRVSSRINNLKKDLIELREIKEKIDSVESNLKEKFSHFSEKGNEQIPDLEQIQLSFNSFRDINEQLDKFSLNKKFYSGWALRIIASTIIFSITAFLFMIFTSSGSYILGLTSGGAAGSAGIISLIYFMKIRKLHPAELLEQKKNMEKSLIELLKKNHFSVDNCKTGELYEILFQYFEDFINYRDITYELSDLKKKISNSAGLAEKEKKLKQFDDEIESINRSINKIIADLDLSIHPMPEPDSIGKTIHEIDELYEENENEIKEKQSMIIKFNEEIEQYDNTENSELSLDLKLDDIIAKINECSENIEHIKFLNSVFVEAAGLWSVNRLEELSRKTLDKFSELTGNTFIREDIAETINTILLTSGVIKREHKGIKKYIAFSLKAALSEILVSGDLPPVFIINPFTPDNEFAENMKKLLPDLFHERQVVIILPDNEPDLKGNLITL